MCHTLAIRVISLDVVDYQKPKICKSYYLQKDKIRYKENV
jgi:hypothetical protein